MSRLSKKQEFELALEALASAHGFKIVPEEITHANLRTVFDADTKPTAMFVAVFDKE